MDEIETIELRLIRYINADGKMGFRMTTPESYNVIEVLGLLEAAKFVIYNDMAGRI